MNQIRNYALLAALLSVSLSSAAAAPCRSESFEGTSYVVCSFNLAKDDLRMFWRNGEGVPHKTFPALADALTSEGLTLSFAVNGGMYGDDFSPIGLYIEEGEELNPANTRTVSGTPSQIPNFFKKPNGVFFIADKAAGVMATDAYLASPPKARFATQSGPMLVIDGKIHPAFIEGSTDLKPRDGVGVSSPTQVHFAITVGVVNFHDFARFFRDKLGCQDALFLDGGTAPGIFSPELERADRPGHGGYGPVIGVVRKQ